MKTKEELNALKNEVKDLNAKLAELSEDEFTQVTGGMKQQLQPNEFHIEEYHCPKCDFSFGHTLGPQHAGLTWYERYCPTCKVRVVVILK